MSCGPWIQLLTVVLAGLVSGWGVGAAACVWGAAGLAYGLGLRWAAHHGYLPFREPE